MCKANGLAKLSFAMGWGILKVNCIFFITKAFFIVGFGILLNRLRVTLDLMAIGNRFQASGNAAGAHERVL